MSGSEERLGNLPTRVPLLVLFDQIVEHGKGMFPIQLATHAHRGPAAEKTE
jgi:hypothetical protein